MTQPYSVTNPKFDAILKHMGELHDRKNRGYALQGDPLANFRISERFGVPAYLGIAVRLSDKINRWMNLVGDANNDQVGEPIEETTEDLAVYAMLFLVALAEYKSLHFSDHLTEDICQHDEEEDASDCCKAMDNDTRDGALDVSPEQQAIQAAGVPVAVVPRGPLSGDTFHGAKPKDICNHDGIEDASKCPEAC